MHPLGLFCGLRVDDLDLINRIYERGKNWSFIWALHGDGIRMFGWQVYANVELVQLQTVYNLGGTGTQARVPRVLYQLRYETKQNEGRMFGCLLACWITPTYQSRSDLAALFLFPE